MCGISGVVHADGTPVDRGELSRMTELIAHRGPDRTSVWSQDGVGLGHTRLSVIDLEHGDQPMLNEDGSVRVVFNGEIYNHHELRAELASNHTFATRSDTEVLVHLYEEEGPELVERLAGFFAFALWDAARKRLVLARDRLGKKPLFFAQVGRRLVFASELRCILSTLPERPELDPRALDETLALRYVDDGRSGVRGVEKLLPGEVAVFEDGTLRRRRFWSPPAPDPREVDDAQALEEFRAGFDASVRKRLEADVPLGLLLSGGIDSTAILEAMSRTAGGRVRTFTVAFTRAKESEATHARAAAEHFGTEHRELTLGEGDLLAHTRHVLAHLDEPFADPSILPTALICRLAREDVTVCLGGDGGDELFGGYSRYARVLADAARAPLAGLRARLMERVLDVLPHLHGKGYKLSRNLTDRLSTPEGRYARSLVSIEAPLRAALYGPRMRAVVDEGELEGRVADELAGSGDLAGRMMEHDLGHYLPGLILTKVDRASMLSSLEMRAPFLDHELVEWTARLPLRLKLAGGVRKVLVRQALRGRVPAELLDKPKRGFGTPLGRWFRDELAPLADEHLRASRLAADGWLDGQALCAVLDAHRAKRRNLGEALWTLLSLEAWYRNFVLHS